VAVVVVVVGVAVVVVGSRSGSSNVNTCRSELKVTIRKATPAFLAKCLRSSLTKVEL